MTTPTKPDPAPLPEPIRAEAAVWLARLHSDQRSEEMERNFRVWLAGNAQRAAAFERMTNTWEATGALRSRPVVAAPEPATKQQRRGVPWIAATQALAAALVLAVTIGFALRLLPANDTPPTSVVETSLGERRSLQLEDGSRLMLNTDSRVSVAFTADSRIIELQRGQARFEVAKDPDRPFIVRAGGKQIVAHGTQFDVRWTDERLSIVLFEGRVSVLAAQQSPDRAGIRMTPGDRLLFEQPTIAIKSAPDLEREEAWVAGRAIFERTPLREAVAEINRYARRPLQLGDASLAELPISGTFSVDDVDAFARALADVLSLRVDDTGDSLVLFKRPRARAPCPDV
jgi:transmembrane sensor